MTTVNSSVKNILHPASFTHDLDYKQQSSIHLLSNNFYELFENLKCYFCRKEIGCSKMFRHIQLVHTREKSFLKGEKWADSKKAEIKKAEQSNASKQLKNPTKKIRKEINSSGLEEAKLQESCEKSVSQNFLMNGLVLRLWRIDDLPGYVKKKKTVKGAEIKSIDHRIPVLKLHRVDESEIKLRTKRSSMSSSADALKQFDDNLQLLLENAKSRQILFSQSNSFQSIKPNETKFQNIKINKRLNSDKENQNSTKKCHVCEKSFLHPQNLKRHLETHKPSEDRKKFQCWFCEKFFSFKNNLHRHIRKHHATSNFKKFQNSKPQLCTQNTSEQQIKFQCHLCKNSYTVKDHLDKHIRSCHQKSNSKKHKPVTVENRKTFSCQHCETSFTVVKNLNRHIKSHHSVLKQNVSEFSREQIQQNDHLKQNADIKKRAKFQCHQCKKSFSLQKKLKRHTHVYHLTSKKQNVTELLPLKNRKQFHCQHCETSYTMKRNLNRHVRSHHSKLKQNVKLQIVEKIFGRLTT